MLVQVINLDRQSERMAEFGRINGHLSEVSRLPAVDGQTLDIGALAGQGLVAPNIREFYSAGATGLAITHVKAWDSAIERQQAMTVCEDDAIFNHGFDRAAAETIRTLPPDWDLILWGWNFDMPMYFEMIPGVSGCLARFQEARLRQAIGLFQSQTISPRAFKLAYAFGTICYTVSPKGAVAMRTRLLPLRPGRFEWPDGVWSVPRQKFISYLAGVDLAMSSIYGELSAFVSVPPLVVTRNDQSASTTQRANARYYI